LIKKDLKAMKYLMLNKDIMILQVGKGSCTVVLDEFTVELPPYAKKFNEICSLRRDLQLSGYPQRFIDSLINSKGCSHPNKSKSLLALCISYM
jgi:hypothetical protein